MEKHEEKQTADKIETQYDKYVSQFQDLLASSQKKGREGMEAAIAAARENLTALGEINTEQGKLFSEYLKRDLAQTSKDMQHLGTEAQDRLNPSRIGAGALAATTEALRLFGHTLINLSDKTSEAITYNVGEVTSAGTLICLKCRARTRLKKTTHIEPCLECSGTIFHKTY